MKKRISSVLVICLILIADIFYGKMAQKKMTVDETVRCLFDYCFQENGEDYFSLCTVYYSEEDGAQDTVYHTTRYPAYEFEVPNESMSGCRWQIYCHGETEDGNYLILAYFIWIFNENVEGKREYSHANCIGYYAVNRVTGHIIKDRIYIDGVPVDNEEFYQILRRSPVVRKDNYD